jgi:hypothetical protein
MNADDYRAGYTAGYMYGRIDAINALPYDDRTPLAKREEAQDDDKKSR